MKTLGSRGWIRSLVQSWFSPPRHLMRRANAVYRLQIERLEDRVVPSAWLVTNTSNSATTSGSLPWAVAQANADTSNATITFDPSDFSSATTITLASTLTLSNTWYSITIDGSGAGPITINGNNVVTNFEVNNDTATIQDLTMTSGSSSTNAGGIFITGGSANATILSCNVNANANGGVNITLGATVTVQNSSISNNTNSNSAGILVTSGSLMISNSTISNNNGNGIQTSSSSTVVVNDCTFTCDPYVMIAVFCFGIG
jgi:Right handed beta helix region